MKIEPILWTHTNKLANDYITGDAKARARYDGISQDEEAWKARIAYLANRPLAAERERLADVLASYNRSIGNHPAALQNIEALRSPETLVVIGGQQAGLFSGPLLVIYKAITIIRQAREAAKRYNRSVVPVFWIAGEDHDFAEVDHVHLLRGVREIQKIQLAKPANDRVSISHLKIPEEQWSSMIQKLAEVLPDTELKPDYIAKLQELHRDADTLSVAFARFMAWLFGREGLILIDSADESVRHLESPMWQQLIANNEEMRQAYLTGKEELEASGYAAQAEVHPDGANLFYIHEGNRLLLMRSGDRYYDRQGLVTFTSEQLAHIAESDPARLSNNVLTRPLMQDYLFPVLAAVLGPGEIAYWGQLKEAFRCLRMQLPIIVPREGYTLLEPLDQKLLAKHGLTIHEALTELEERRQSWLKSQETFDVDGEFAAVEEDIRRLYMPLVEKSGSISPVMRQLGESNLERIIAQVQYYQNRLKREIEAKHEVGLRQFDRLSVALKPHGIPQERVYTVISYLNHYGEDWIGRLLTDHQPDPHDHQHHYVIYL